MLAKDMKTSIHIDKKIFKHYNIRSTDVQLEFLLKFNHNQSFIKYMSQTLEFCMPNILRKISTPLHPIPSSPFHLLQKSTVCVKRKNSCCFLDSLLSMTRKCNFNTQHCLKHWSPTLNGSPFSRAHLTSPAYIISYLNFSA